MQYRSQYGQDALIGDVLFRGRTGVFVDVGARDGKQISNTIYLEQACGWTGIAVEPHPDLYARLRNTRKCQCFNLAASDQERPHMEFIKFLEEPYGNSGLRETFRNPRRLESIKHEVIQVPTMPLSKLLHDVRVVHYLDVDVEGHELEVLMGIDFEQVEIRIIGVEVAERGSIKDSIDSMLATKGYYPFLQLVSDRFYCFGQDIPSAAHLRGLS